MSSDLFDVDGPFFHPSSREMVYSDVIPFFSDPFYPFCHDSSTDIIQDLLNNQNTQNQVHDANSVDNFNPSVLSYSPPNHQLASLTLYQAAHFQPVANESSLVNCSSLANGHGDLSGLDGLEVKTEECRVGFDSSYYHQSFVPHSYSGVENVAKMMQRSFSSNCFDGKPAGLRFQPHFDTLLESPNYQTQPLSSPENNFLASQLRRVCSTGDLQNIGTARTTQRSFSSRSATESSFIEEANFKVGRYSAEERKEKISKYRAKRSQRNFTKTIKYACRKTLADNRPRIRGRFARNDETGEIPKAASSARDEDEDELWFDGLHEDAEDYGTMRGGGRGAGGGFVNCFGQPQYQYHGH